MCRAMYVLLLVCIFFSASAEYKSVSFIQASPEEVIESLQETGQYSVVYFTADWCLPCQILEAGHFRDERIINLINNGLLSVKADYSEKNDIDWYAKYEVKMLPTLLVIDQDGNEVNRIHNIDDTKELYLFLHQYSQLPITKSKPLAFKLEEKKKSINHNNYEKSNWTVADDQVSQVKLVSNPSSNAYYYTKNAEVEKNSLSIQFAAYTRYKNALKYLNTLLKEGMPVSIIEEHVDGKKYFKVIQQVSSLNVKSIYNQYQSQGIDCFIRSTKANT